MSSITSSITSSSSSVPASIEMMSSSSSSLTDLDSRIQQIRQKCEELRKQKPKYLSLYEFGFLISVIGAAAAIFLFSKELLTCSFLIGKLFGKTVFRNNDRIQSIDALQQAEIDQQTILNFTTSLRRCLGISQNTLTQMKSGLNADSNMADVTSTIGSIYQSIKDEIRQSIAFLRAYDKEYGNITHNLDLSLVTLEAEENMAIRPKTISNPLRMNKMNKMNKRIENLANLLHGLDQHILRVNSKIQGTVNGYQEVVNLKTELMNRWFI